MLKKRDADRGIKLITYATAVRWFGWGFVEALIPIFLFQLSKNYIESGLLRAVYSIIFFVSLPFAGMLADRISAKKIILFGLLLYPFIGASYFIAGFIGLVSLVIFARALNGIGYSFDTVGRNTFMRKYSEKNKVSSNMGYFDTITTFWWLCGMAISLLFVSLVPIYYLFLMIIPTSIIAIIMFSTLKDDKKGKFKDGVSKVWNKGVYSSMFKELLNWNGEVKLIAFLTFFVAVISTTIYFFIPIYAYTHNEGLVKVVLITIVLSIPVLFGGFLGKMADRYKYRCLTIGLALLCAVIASLYFITDYYLLLIVAFIMGIVIELVEITNYGLSTLSTKKEDYGKLSSAMSGIKEFGWIIGPIFLGFAIDRLGMANTFLITAGITFVVLVLLARVKSKIRENI